VARVDSPMSVKTQKPVTRCSLSNTQQTISDVTFAIINQTSNCSVHSYCEIPLFQSRNYVNYKR